MNIGLVFLLMSQCWRKLRSGYYDQGNSTLWRNGDVEAAGHLQILLRNRCRVLPVRPANLLHEIRFMDFGWQYGNFLLLSTINSFPIFVPSYWHWRWPTRARKAERKETWQQFIAVCVFHCVFHCVPVGPVTRFLLRSSWNVNWIQLEIRRRTRNRVFHP